MGQVRELSNRRGLKCVSVPRTEAASSCSGRKQPQGQSNGERSHYLQQVPSSEVGVLCISGLESLVSLVLSFTRL